MFIATANSEMVIEWIMLSFKEMIACPINDKGLFFMNWSTFLTETWTFVCLIYWYVFVRRTNSSKTIIKRKDSLWMNWKDDEKKSNTVSGVVGGECKMIQFHAISMCFFWCVRMHLKIVEARSILILTQFRTSTAMHDILKYEISTIFLFVPWVCAMQTQYVKSRLLQTLKHFWPIYVLMSVCDILMN